MKKKNIKIDPTRLAQKYYEEVRQEVEKQKLKLKLVGLLTEHSGPSKTYATYTRRGCEAAGIDFDLWEISRLKVEDTLDELDRRKDVHGVIVYYPVFASEQDHYIRDLLSFKKDVEGLNSYWARKLYHNERFVDQEKTKKAILPCTPLAILKLLSETGVAKSGEKPLGSQVISIFNRSEIVGRPLASMLANDGAKVYSIDIHGTLEVNGPEIKESPVERPQALSEADVIITGVPTREFKLVSASEIKEGAVCLNFSTLKNFNKDIMGKASHFVPRVGPMTIAMVMRNTLRLYQNFHSSGL